MASATIVWSMNIIATAKIIATRTSRCRGVRVLVEGKVGLLGNGGGSCASHDPGRGGPAQP
jgi:hypothetical protein